MPNHFYPQTIYPPGLGSGVQGWEEPNSPSYKASTSSPATAAGL